jgi:DNA-binding transcriptional ArsR family regulator
MPLRMNGGAATLSQMDNYSGLLDSIFHALADPTRRAIVQRLGRGPATVTELAQPFAMALPSLMKHVGVLEETGLIRSKKTGRVRTCVLERKKLAAVELWLGRQRAVWQARYGSLDELLVELNGEDDAD